MRHNGLTLVEVLVSITFVIAVAVVGVLGFTVLHFISKYW